MIRDVFPEPIASLPEADVPVSGVKAYLSQSETHQILFMTFEKEVDVPVHSHESQWGVVIDGMMELEIDGQRRILTRGDHYFIPAGANHSARISAGYADVTFFNQPNRYTAK